MAPDPYSQAGGQRSRQTGAPVAPAAAGRLLARGAFPIQSEASVSIRATTLPLRPSHPGALPRATASWRSWWPVVGVSVAASASLLGVLGARGGLPRKAASGPATATATATAPAMPPLQRPFVSVALRATAPGARFRFEDGREVASPHVGLVPYDERPQTVWVEANGYLPKKLPLVFSDDVTVDDVRLVPIDPAPARSSRPPPPRRGADDNVLLPRTRR
ncbi:MAG TPA: hypothetical protein VFS43_35515 [Polyangiaceae bacterium]|nr:hypothetical protein [Polyangiaceae bacterium]